MFTVKETATQLSVSPATVYALISTGKLRCHRVGVGRGVIRVSTADLDAYLNTCRHDVTEERRPQPRRSELKHLKL